MKIKLKKFKIVKSTNDIALEFIKKNMLDPMIITSEKQTNGRGRIGKKWISQRGGNFLFQYSLNLIKKNKFQAVCCSKCFSPEESDIKKNFKKN